MKVNLRTFSLVILSVTLVFASSCRDEDGDVNIFTVQQDKEFGAQVSAEFEKDPNIKILDSASNVSIYKYIYGLRDSILKTGLVRYKDLFPWRIRIIKNDTTLNAFCTPGGYIYFYTGILKFLESEDQVAGVMGHEMAHADKRHSTDAMTREYGIQLLLDVVFGQNKGQLARIAAGLGSLKYSRKAETEADMFSVEWLYQTAYNAKGAAGFFQKMIDMGAQNPPQFLSTHPNPDNRVKAIEDKWTALGGKVGQDFKSRYVAFKATLP